MDDQSVEAYRFWDHIRALKPDWEEARRLQVAERLQAGRTCLDQTQPARALDHFRAAISADPGSAEARVALATALIETGKFDSALAAWREAFDFKPEWPEVHYPVQNHFYHYGQRDAAREIQDRCVKHLDATGRARNFDQLNMRVLREYPTAIGHIGLLDNYAKARILGLQSAHDPVLMVHPLAANRAYLDYWREYFPRMINNPVAIDLLRPIAPYIEDRIVPVMGPDHTIAADQDYVGVTRQGAVQLAWEKAGRGPLLKLTDQDLERGWSFLKSCGVPQDAWFVGLHVREAAGALRGARNAAIEHYLDAVQAVTARGGWVVRTGDPNMTPLPQLPQVIDYAHSTQRSDWLDVFLWGAAKFFICTPSGPAWIPPTFGVPCVATNWNAFMSWRWYGQDLFIPKLFYSERENRYLKFAEILNTPLAIAEAPAFFKLQQVRLVDNSADEITEVVTEMLSRLIDNKPQAPGDRDQQARVKALWRSRTGQDGAEMGSGFIKRWAALAE